MRLDITTLPSYRLLLAARLPHWLGLGITHISGINSRLYTAHGPGRRRRWETETHHLTSPASTSTSSSLQLRFAALHARALGLTLSLIFVTSHHASTLRFLCLTQQLPAVVSRLSRLTEKHRDGEYVVTKQSATSCGNRFTSTGC